MLIVITANALNQGGNVFIVSNAISTIVIKYLNTIAIVSNMLITISNSIVIVSINHLKPLIIAFKISPS